MLARRTISLRELTNWKVGDILPIDTPRVVDLLAEGLTVAKGDFGLSGGKNAIKISEVVYPSGRPRTEARTA